jgi:hypothetical protein
VPIETIKNVCIISYIMKDFNKKSFVSFLKCDRWRWTRSIYRSFDQKHDTLRHNTGEFSTMAKHLQC